MNYEKQLTILGYKVIRDRGIVIFERCTSKVDRKEKLVFVAESTVRDKEKQDKFLEECYKELA